MTDTIQQLYRADDFPARRRAVAVLTGSIAIIGANSLSLGPIAPDIAATLATSVSRVMWAAGSYGFATAAGALLLARHIDRIGAPGMLAAALAVLAAAFAVSTCAPGIITLVVAQAVAGIAAGVALPAIYAFAAMIAPPGRESAVVGTVLVGWTVSMVAGVSLAAVIADLGSWRLVYGLLTLCAAAASVVITRLYHPAPPESAAPSRPDRDESGSDQAGNLNEVEPGPLVPGTVGNPVPRFSRAVLVPLATPGVAGLLAVCFVFMTGFYGVYGYVGDHIHRALAQPVAATGLLTLVYGAGFGAAALADPLLDRLGWRRIMPPAFAVVALIYLLLGLAAPSYYALVAIAFAWGTANHFGLNLIVTGLSALDPARRGAVLGLNSAVTYVAVSVGTLGFGPVYQSYGFSSLAFAAAGLCLIAIVLSAAQSRHPMP